MYLFPTFFLSSTPPSPEFNGFLTAKEVREQGGGLSNIVPITDYRCHCKIFSKNSLEFLFFFTAWSSWLMMVVIL